MGEKIKNPPIQVSIRSKFGSLFLLVFPVIWLASCVTSETQDQKTRKTGIVTYAGDPVSDVLILVTQKNGTTDSIYSDSNGNFSFEPTEEAYSVYAKKDSLFGIFNPDTSSENGSFTITLISNTSEIDLFDPPSLAWSSPKQNATGALARVNRFNSYDVALQFTHAMDTRLTSDAVKVSSSDQSIELASIKWQGADVIYVTFKRKFLCAYCANSKDYRVGSKYSLTVDTTARSLAGAAVASPIVVEFEPEPFPRLTKVTGFRVSADANFEELDSLPPAINLGNNVSPSIAFTDGNQLVLQLIGEPDSASTIDNIICSENSSPVNCTFRNVPPNLYIKFPNFFKSDANYEIDINSELQFVEGISLPHHREINWNTLKFKMDTATIFGLGPYSKSIPVSSASSGYPLPMFSIIQPRNPLSVFYASTHLDTSTVRANLNFPEFFDLNNLIISENSFGLQTPGWLEPGKEMNFVIQSGLTSAGGDTLESSKEYSIKTEPYKLTQFKIFDLTVNFQSIVNGQYHFPKQDTIYDAPLGYLSKISDVWNYEIRGYDAYVATNSPLDTNDAMDKFSVTPDNGFIKDFHSTGLRRRNTEMLRPDTTYTIQLSNGLKNSFGNELQKEFSYKFKTEKFSLRVGNLFGVQVGWFPDTSAQTLVLPGQPLPNITIINQGIVAENLMILADANFLVGDSLQGKVNWVEVVWQGKSSTPIGLNPAVFIPNYLYNKNFLSFSGIPDTATFMDHIQITPDDNSILFKVERNKLKFSANTFSQPNKEYSIKIDEGFKDIYGHTLGDSIVVTYKTPSYSLTSSQVGSQKIVRDSILAGKEFNNSPLEGFKYSLQFTHSVDPTTMKGNIVGTPPLVGTMFANKETLNFTSSLYLVPDTTYVIEIKPGLQEKWGNDLDTNYQITFRTESFKATSLSMGTIEENSLFSANFNAVLDTNSVDSGFVVNPSHYQNGTVELNDTKTGFSFTPDDSITVGDTITITLTDKIKEAHNVGLKEEKSLEIFISAVNWRGKRARRK